jgi:hypothetical protein
MGLGYPKVEPDRCSEVGLQAIRSGDEKSVSQERCSGVGKTVFDEGIGLI